MKLISLLFICFTLGIVVYSSSFSVAEKTKEKEHSPISLPLLKSERYSSASYGIAVIDTETDSLIFAIDEKRALNPASINKLFTSWNAFSALGSDYRYETKLTYSGSIENGILNGNLFLISSGDPTIESARFKTTEGFFVECSKIAKSAGIKQINGDIICIASKQRHNAHPNWTWQDIGNYYGAGVYDFNIFDNTVKVFFNTPKKAGDTALITSTSPSLPVEFVSEVISSKLRYDSSYFYGAPNELKRTGRGKLPAGRKNFRVRVSLPNPPLMAAYILKTELNSNSITVKGDYKTQSHQPDGLKILYTYQSPELKEIATILNKRSMNLYAEALFKTVANSKIKQYNRSYHTASTLFEKDLKKLFSDSTGFSYVDGSGLSRFNTCTALQMAELLAAFKHNQSFDDFLPTLPIAGVDGTLEHFGKGIIKEKVKAKTGSMTGVRSLAGYLDAQSGKHYAFAFIFNHFEGKSKYVKADFETILETLYKEL